MPVQILSIYLSHIRGFSDASLDLQKNSLVLVGENNAGKSAALIILDWIFNRAEVLSTKPELKQRSNDWEILSPARQVGKKARRIALGIRFKDGRTGRKYGSDNKKEVILRFDMKKSRELIVAKLGDPKRSETLESDPRAIDLLKLLQKTFHFEHITAYREVGSNIFSESLKQVIDTKLTELAIHDTQAGAPLPYRKFSIAADNLVSETTKHLQPLLDEMANSITDGLVHKAAPKIDVDKGKLAKWLASNTSLKLVTGLHDEDMVDAKEVGSGLQSSLDLALRNSLIDEGKKIIVAIDEPEAFLHPSAQRSFAREILTKTSPARHKKIITTHSPIIVEEAEYKDIVVAADQKFYSPNTEALPRNDINTLFLCGQGAEMMFASSILFVEGESDRLFFEMLRRRLALKDDTGQLDKAYVVAVGGKTSFAPWMRLLNSYTDQGGNKHFHWVAVGDGDASTDMKQALENAGYELKQDFLDISNATHRAYVEKEIENWHTNIYNLNNLAKSHKNPIRLLSGDLEYAALNNITAHTYNLIKENFNDFYGNNKEDLINWLGSKGITGDAVNNGAKQPWRRLKIAELLAIPRLDSSIKSVLREWLSPFDLPNAVIKNIRET